MIILIAPSLMQCAILGVHLFLEERSGDSITLPGLIQEWQTLSISILFVVLKRGFVSGAEKLHEESGGTSKSVRPTTLSSASLPKIIFS